jgi:hypothetical protein
MQKTKQNYFKDRSIYYATFPISNQAQKGIEWDFNLKAVYFVGILDFVFDDNKGDDNYYHHEIKLMDTLTKQVFYDKLAFIYLEMPKFSKTEEELQTHFDKWLYVLKNLPNLEKRPAKLQERVFETLFRAAEIAKFSHKEVDAYEESLKGYRDFKNSMDTAEDIGIEKGEKRGFEKGEKVGIKKGEKRGIKKGEKIGIKKGEKIGIEKGEKIGIEKGEKIGIEKGEKIGIEKERKENRIKVVRTAIQQNLSIDIIKALTGLSEEEINKLR